MQFQTVIIMLYHDWTKLKLAFRFAKENTGLLGPLNFIFWSPFYKSLKLVAFFIIHLNFALDAKLSFGNFLAQQREWGVAKSAIDTHVWPLKSPSFEPPIAKTRVEGQRVVLCYSMKRNKTEINAYLKPTWRQKVKNRYFRRHKVKNRFYGA